MNDIATSNSPNKVQFRENIINVQEGLLKIIANGTAKDTLPDCKLTHYYSPID
jgi:hypothetical protein